MNFKYTKCFVVKPNSHNIPIKKSSLHSRWYSDIGAKNLPGNRIYELAGGGANKNFVSPELLKKSSKGRTSSADKCTKEGNSAKTMGNEYELEIGNMLRKLGTDKDDESDATIIEDMMALDMKNKSVDLKLELALSMRDSKRFESIMFKMTHDGFQPGFRTLIINLKALRIFGFKKAIKDNILKMIEELKLVHNDIYAQVVNLYSVDKEFTKGWELWNALILSEKPNENLVNSMINLIIEEGKLADALSFWNQQKTKYNLQINNEIHCSITDIQYRLNNVKKADQYYLNHIRKFKKLSQISCRIFTVRMRHYRVTEKDYKICLFTFLMIEKSGMAPDAENYQEIIAASYELDERENCIKFFKQMINNSILPNESIWLKAMNCYYDKRNVRELEKIFVIGYKANSVPRDSVMSCLVKGILVNNKDPDRALAYVVKVASEKCFIPSVQCFNAILIGYLNKTDLSSMIQLYRLILKLKVKPDLITFLTMVKGYLTFGYYKFASEMFSEPGLHGIPNANRFLFSEIIKLLVEENPMAIDLINNFNWAKLVAMEDRIDEINTVLSNRS